MKYRSVSDALLSSSVGQRLVSLVDPSCSHQVVFLGLDRAGKSTTLYRLKTDQYVDAAPTFSFNTEKIKPPTGRARGHSFTLWDISGQEQQRSLWRTYTRQADALVFVIDSCDPERFEEARLELTTLLRCPDVSSTMPILFLANKQDMPAALPETDILQAVGAPGLGANHPTDVLSCCAITGEGMDSVIFDTLLELIEKSRALRKKNAVRKR